MDIVSKEAQIAGHMQNLEAIKESYEGLVTLQKAGKKLTSQQQQSLNNFEPTVQGAQRAIESLRAAIREGKQKVNGLAHS